MKKKILYTAFVLLAASGAACTSDDYADGTPYANKILIDEAATTPEAKVTFKKTVTDLDRTFRATFVSPVARETEVEFSVDEVAVAAYNARHGTNYRLLDKAYYAFSALTAKVEAGKSVSEAVTVHFQDLAALDIDVTALLPVTISGNTAGVAPLSGSETIYFLVRRSSAITTAASLSDCYMWVPSFETDAGRAAVNGLTALTYEAIVYVHDFSGDAGISSVMGVEQHCLLRIGDTDFPRQQLQTQIGGSKFPEADKSKELQPGEWYHLAMTWDIATARICFYVNGQLQSEGTLAYDKPTIDLARTEASAYRFLIGYSYNTGRLLNGLISQVRIWSVARTQEEIFRDMYDVDAPETKPELRAWWKFDEGQGNTIKDWSQYGNDAQCLDGKNEFEAGDRNEGKLRWDNSIEIPQMNKEQ